MHSCTHGYVSQDPSSKNRRRDDILNVIRQASEHDLTMSGNMAYMRLELTLARVTNEKIQLESSKRSLEDEIIRLKSRLETTEYVIVCFDFSDYRVFSTGK